MFAEETKARVYHEAAKERTMDNFILTFTEDEDVRSKIKAIKAVRMILGLGLKDAKDIIQANGRFEHGIIVSKLQSFAINGMYVEEFAFSDTIKGERFHDFTFERIPEVPYREDFTGAVPLGDPATRDTRGATM